jgi:hypothetical protein
MRGFWRKMWTAKIVEMRDFAGEIRGNLLKRLVRPARLELATSWFVGRALHL